MPPNTVYVGRPGMWGNPFKAGQAYHFGGGLIDNPILAFRLTMTNEAAWPYMKR